MKRIYLDQNKWIDLAAAEKGLEKGRRFADALVLIRAAVDAGNASLPLSSAHYMETQHRRHWASRRDLAITMLTYSRLHTIAPSDPLLPGEFDLALKAFFGRPDSPQQIKPFGIGIAHAFNKEIEPYRIPASIRPKIGNALGIEQGVMKLREALLLAGVPPDLEAQIPDYKPLSHLEIGDRYAENKESLRELRTAAGWHKGERAERVAKAEEVVRDLVEL